MIRLLIFLSFVTSWTLGAVAAAQSNSSSLSHQDIPLSEKSAHFERIIRARHVKDGFVRELTLDAPGDISKGGFLHHSDNDGLWTGLYVAAMSFKYAVSKDPETRAWAQEGLNALLRLEKITGLPGFPARSIVAAGEPIKFSYDGEWHPDSTGQWEWKGNTSSDELAGHFFAYSVYYDLVADDNDKSRIRETVRRIMDRIIQSDWYLIDVDGKPTRWGVWNPRQLNENKSVHGLPDEDWKEEKGLGSLEILSHLKVTYHMTGDVKYEKAYRKLIKKYGYADNTVNLKITEPPESVNHSDDELAFCAYYPLLKYETNPKLSIIYKRSLSRTWEIERPERNPWWNFTYCVFIGGDCAAPDSLRTLTEIPLDQLNRKKAGVSLQRWNGNPYSDSGGGGNIEGDGALFLLPYWMGRHHGFIESLK